jgi:hypothetical protein
MRRWMTAAFVAFLVSGCSASPRSAEPEAAAPLPAGSRTAAPAAGPTAAASPMCHPRGLAATGTAPTGTVDCAAPHGAETIYVGELPGAPAAAPAAGSPAQLAAYAECDKRAAAHLGADWRTARLRLAVVLPTAAAWSGGARWYRCDVEEVSLIGPDGRGVTRSGGLAGALAAADAPLRLLCNRMEIDRARKVINVPPVPCEQKHNGEFVGVWRATPTTYPARTEDYIPFFEACREAIGAYAGVPVDRWLVHRADVVPVLAPAAEWKAGDRGVRCYLYLNDRQVTRSLKGAGDKGLPVRGRPS